MDSFISVFTESGSAQPMEEAVKMAYSRNTDSRVPSGLSSGEDKPVNNHNDVISIDLLFSEVLSSRIGFSVFCICAYSTLFFFPSAISVSNCIYLRFLMPSNKLLQI